MGAYARLWRSERSRQRALDHWLHRYNHHRHHTAIGGPPASRVTNLSGDKELARGGRELSPVPWSDLERGLVDGAVENASCPTGEAPRRGDRGSKNAVTTRVLAEALERLADQLVGRDASSVFAQVTALRRNGVAVTADRLPGSCIRPLGASSRDEHRKAVRFDSRSAPRHRKLIEHFDDDVVAVRRCTLQHPLLGLSVPTNDLQRLFP